MTDPDDVDPSIPLSWIVLFLLLALGVGAVTIRFLGGSFITGAGFVLL